MTLWLAPILRSTVLSLLGAAAAAVVPSSVLAAAGQHTTLASFQQNVRADVLFEQFNGAAQNFNAPYPVSGNGYQFAVQSSQNGVRRDGNGIGSRDNDQPTQFVFSGGGERPVTAFAGTMRVVNEFSTSIGGTVTITLSTGEVFTLNVPVSGMFFGVTTAQPFTSLLVEAPHAPGPAFILEWIDDVYVGTSGTAAAAADQCADASMISTNSAAQYPFTTVGATATLIQGVCDGTTDSGPDVWFRFVSPVEGRITAGTCGCTFDSILRVFAACPSGLGEGQLACNDDSCAGGGSGFFLASQVSLRVEAGEDYYIRVSGFDGNSGSGNLTLSVVPDCRADFNHSGGLEVQDIFDFLNRWFAGCP
jgi:hypothetical protein